MTFPKAVSAALGDGSGQRCHAHLNDVKGESVMQSYHRLAMRPQIDLEARDAAYRWREF